MTPASADGHAADRPDVLFVHGLWLHSTSWQPWIELFGRSGYRARATRWPGEPETVEHARQHPDAVAGVGIDEIVAHHAELIRRMDHRPVLVGHSFGGLVVERLLGEDLGVAGIAIDAAQIKGVLPLPLSSLRATLPVFRNPANRHRAVSLTAEQFRFGFGNAVPEDESDALWARWAVPAPGRPLFEAAAANLVRHSPAQVDTANDGRGPLLLMMGERDHTVPEAITKATLKQYRGSAATTDLLEMAGRGHSLTVDSGWPDVAAACLRWLDEQHLQRSAPGAGTRTAVAPGAATA